MGYQADGQTLTKAPLDYYRMFYCDTVLQGEHAGPHVRARFFGEDHMLFGTDAPYDSRMEENVYRETIAAVDAMDISADTRQKIYVDNARKLFRLSE